MLDLGLETFDPLLELAIELAGGEPTHLGNARPIAADPACGIESPPTDAWA
jgi:hypothetical protein